MALKSQNRAAAGKAKLKGNKTVSIKKAIVSTPAQLRAIPNKQSKVQILRAIAEETGLSIKQVKEVFARASHLAKCHLVKKGSGEFSIPEMAIKVVRKTKPASKQRIGRNPLTGETITIPPKPKREIIRVRPLKSLKEVLA